MTDSRFQLHDRIDNLTGKLKAAEELDRLNEDDYAVKEHALNLSSQARQKGKDNIARIKQALMEAGEAYSKAVRELVGDAPQDITTSGAGLSDYQRAYFAKHGEIPVNLPQLGDETCDECGAPGGIHRGDCRTAESAVREMAFIGQVGEPILNRETAVEILNEHNAVDRFPNAIFNGIDRAFDEATQP